MQLSFSVIIRKPVSDHMSIEYLNYAFKKASNNYYIIIIANGYVKLQQCPCVSLRTHCLLLHHHIVKPLPRGTFLVSKLSDHFIPFFLSFHCLTFNYSISCLYFDQTCVFEEKKNQIYSLKTKQKTP